MLSIDRLEPGPRFNVDQNYPVDYSLFDADNTLVSNNGSELPSDRFVATALEAGELALLGLATARPLSKAEHILASCRMQGLSILSNGAQIFDGRRGEMIIERTLPQQPLSEIVHHLQSEGIAHWVQDDGVDYRWGGHVQASNEDLGAYMRPNNIWLPASAANNAIQIPAYQPYKPFVVVAHSITDEQVGQFTQMGNSFKDNHVTSLVAHETPQPDGTKRYELFFLHTQSNKRDALQLVSEVSRVPLENTMATGDGPNDTVIVEYAGVGVAMGNGVDATKAVATWIAPRREHDGAAIALRQLVLTNRNNCG